MDVLAEQRAQLAEDREAADRARDAERTRFERWFALEFRYETPECSENEEALPFGCLLNGHRAKRWLWACWQAASR